MSTAMRAPARPETTMATAVDARSLSRRSRADLDALFASLPAPAGAAIRGDLRGIQIDLAGLERLPRALRAAILAALRGPLGLWRGKRVVGERGTNLWGIGPFRRSFAEFRVETAAALRRLGAVSPARLRRSREPAAAPRHPGRAARARSRPVPRPHALPGRLGRRLPALLHARGVSPRAAAATRPTPRSVWGGRTAGCF